jgi:putative redox protein
MAKNVRLALAGPMKFRVATGTGHEVVLDADATLGGANEGMRPTEAVLVALGGCAGMDVISILRKMRQDVTAYDVSVAGEQRPERPQIYTSIEVTHRVRGRGVRPEAVRRAIGLSMGKYCPVHAMLKATVPIHAAFVVENEGESAVEGTLTPDEIAAIAAD